MVRNNPFENGKKQNEMSKHNNAFYKKYNNKYKSI